ncbi:hypothetical protein [Anthocerotibacter panamensis]|uniref:hypothetical protein n=1 Tax=Anthocerotibacter panamensis TaxID=2857077 RepID=UPI001C40800A|nr:hypothetical protein [Anthocerotibacter panamensis]
MFILTPDQVARCPLSLDDRGTALFSGLEYHGRVYTAIKEYPLSESHRALAHCRELLDQDICCLFLQEANKLSLWIAQAGLRKVGVERPSGTTLRYRGAAIPIPESFSSPALRTI